MSFGANLKSLRNDLGLSQEALASALGSTQRHVSFLETGRSSPSQAMIGRLATELQLSAAQRATLFESSGYTNPYRRRDFTSTEVIETLDMLEHRVLAHWPFPGMVMDADWNVLRMNAPAAALFGMVGNITNMLELFLSPDFTKHIENWEECSSAFYFRLQSAAARNDTIRYAFEEARLQGMFDHIPTHMTRNADIPIFIPAIIRLPDGSRLKLTSILGSLVSVHDALVEGFDIELMLPVDAESERLMLGK